MITTEVKVLDAIRARGTQNFSGAEIAGAAGLCRQTVYKIIRKLNAKGHRIEAYAGLGFMARVKEEQTIRREVCSAFPPVSSSCISSGLIGPNTAEGRERIRQAQLARWRASRSPV